MRDPRYSLFARRWRATTSQSRADKGIRDWIAKNVDQTTADEIRIQYGAVWKSSVRRVHPIPSSRHRVDGVEDDAMIQHERAVKF